MEIVEFIEYLTVEKKASENTREAYRRDIAAFETFLRKRGVLRDEEASNADVAAYMMELKSNSIMLYNYKIFFKFQYI